MAKPKKQMKGVSCSTRKGVAYWYAHINGRKTYCGSGDEGKQVALASKAKEMAQKFELREVQAGLKTHRIEFRTVRDLLVWYTGLPEVQELKSYPSILSLVAHLSEYFGNKPIAGLDADAQRRYRQQRKATGAAPSTVDQEFKILGVALNMAHVEGKITTDMKPRKLITENKQTPRRIVTDAEYKALMAKAEGDFADVLVCGWETGMRVSEILNLTAGQVRLNVKHISGDVLDYIHLGVFDTKTGAERIVPVSPELKTVFERRLNGLDKEAVVFTIESHKIDKDGVAFRLEALCKKAGVAYGDKPKDARGGRTGIVFHCFRHTRVSKWVKAGYSDEIIRRASGHRSLAAYQTYVKLDAHTMMRLVSDTKTDKSGTKQADRLENRA